MEHAGVMVPVLAFSWMKLHHHVLPVPEQILDPAEDLPGGNDPRVLETRHRDVFPSPAVARDARDREHARKPDLERSVVPVGGIRSELRMGADPELLGDVEAHAGQRFERHTFVKPPRRPCAIGAVRPWQVGQSATCRFGLASIA